MMFDDIFTGADFGPFCEQIAAVKREKDELQHSEPSVSKEDVLKFILSNKQYSYLDAEELLLKSKKKVALEKIARLARILEEHEETVRKMKEAVRSTSSMGDHPAFEYMWRAAVNSSPDKDEKEELALRYIAIESSMREFFDTHCVTPLQSNSRT